MSNKDQATWHKALCIAFRKLGIVEMLITDDDLEALQNMPADDMPAMVAASAEDGLHLVLTTQKEAKEFAASLESSKIIKPH